MEVTDIRSCDQCWYISKDNPIMTSTTNSSRVKAPAYNTTQLPTVDVDQNKIENDGISPNPKERDILDNKYMRAKNKLLKCRKILNISIMNVRTIRLKSKKEELANNMKMNNINILGIVDHKINHTDKIIYENIGNLTLITSSAWRNSNSASVGGIGIMVDRSSENVITEIKKWNPMSSILMEIQ